MKYIKYLTLAIKFISMADKAQVLDTILYAIKDGRLSANELIEIAKKICQAAGIDLDTTGIKL